MQEHKINSFNELMKYRICEHFITLTGKKVYCSESLLTDKKNIEADYGSHIIISGENNGKVSTFLTENNAFKIICLMMGMEKEDIDKDFLIDGVNEISNIISGWLKAELNNINYNVDMGNPSNEIIDSGIKSYNSEDPFMSFVVNIDEIIINIIIEFQNICNELIKKN